jgi:membrane-bound lytic murein transglycosylase D
MIKNISLLLCLVFASCALQTTKEIKKEVVDTSVKDDKHEALKTQGHIPECGDDCITGSSTEESLSASDKKVYFLYGAEHLKLNNSYFDIPVVYNKQTKKWIKYFTGRGRKLFTRYSARAGRYAPVLSKILDDMGLPRDLIYLAMAESGFHNSAKSWAKAVGPWQFMPRTGKTFGLKQNWYVDERRDPIKATKAAGTYLSKLYNMMGSWELAMASYNAGEGKMKRAIRRYRTRSFWKIIRGRYLKSETKNYVPKIMALAIIGKNLNSFGFKDTIDYKEHLDFDEVVVHADTDLFKVSQTLNVDFEALKYLNPELRRWQTPANIADYRLRIPAGMKVVWSQCCAKLDHTATDFQKYVSRSRTRLDRIARKYKIKARVLASLNNMKPKARVGRKQTIILPFREGQSKRDPMYADLYDRPRKSVRRRRKYRNRLKLALRRGTKIKNPSSFYTVKKGDSLWSVSRKTGVSLDTIIKTNYRLVKRRMILPGDKLAIQ